MNIPAITLYRPWAQWILWGHKTIETRRHKRFASLCGQTIGIIAGQKWDDNGYISCPAGHDYTDPVYLETGLLCIVDVIEARRCTPADSAAANIECDTERWGLVLANVRERKRRDVLGSQGIKYINA